MSVAVVVIVSAVASKRLGRTGMQPEHVCQLAVLVAGEARKRFSAAA